MELAIVIPDDYAYDCFRVPAAKLGGRCVYTKGAKHCSEVIGYACVEGQCFEWPLDGTFLHIPCTPSVLEVPSADITRQMLKIARSESLRASCRSSCTLGNASHSTPVCLLCGARCEAASQ